MFEGSAIEVGADGGAAKLSLQVRNVSRPGNWLYIFLMQDGCIYLFIYCLLWFNVRGGDKHGCLPEVAGVMGVSEKTHGQVASSPTSLSS